MTTINITTNETKTITFEGARYRRWDSSYYRIDEQACVKVDKLQIEAFDNDLRSPWDAKAEDCTELEFYTAYAATRQRLDAIANVENLYLNETAY
jgi:hypothetical protein